MVDNVTDRTEQAGLGASTENLLRQDYDRNGYAIVRGLLDADEVSALRETAAGIYAVWTEEHGGTPPKTLFADTILENDAFLALTLRPRLVAALSAILGPNYSMIMNLSLPRNQAAMKPTRLLGRRGAGWHLDSSAEGKQRYFLDDHYRFAKCGIYLQDNTEEWGGGIDVVPGHHKFPLRFDDVNWSFRVKTAADLLGIVFSARRVDIRAGDAVIFDSRLPHRSTIPANAAREPREEDIAAGFLTNVPPEKAKYVLYWDNGARPYADAFVAHAEKRARHEIEQGRPSTYLHFAALRWPDDFPEKFRSLADEAGVHVGSLPLSVAEEFHQAMVGMER